MLKQIKKNNITWIDIENPQKEDLDFLEKKFKIHPVILNELVSPSSRTKVDSYKDYIFAVYHLPIYSPKEKSSMAKEMDFIILKNTLITARYSKIEPLNQLFEELENDNVDDKENKAYSSVEHLLYDIIQNNLNFSLRQLHHIGDKIDYIGSSIFKSKEKKMIREISYVKRDVLNQRLIVRPQKTILESLVKKGTDFLGEKSAVYFNDLLGDHSKIWDTLDNFKEAIESLEETNNTLFESRTNEVMKLLTVMAFFALPLSLFTSLFSMKTIYTPFVDNQSGFWIIIAIMVLISVFLYIFFKIKKWL